MIWFGGNIHQHSFIAWLAIRDHLMNRDRIHRWDALALGVALCVMESRDHLFFECSFGYKVWVALLH